jgi:hypothetical protein
VAAAVTEPEVCAKLLGRLVLVLHLAGGRDEIAGIGRAGRRRAPSRRSSIRRAGGRGWGGPGPGGGLGLRALEGDAAERVDGMVVTACWKRGVPGTDDWR